MNIFLAIIFGLLYWVSRNDAWYPTLHFVRAPIVIAIPVGLIMGDLENAMKIGAAMQTLYMLSVAAGGQVTSDPALASYITIPLALKLGLSPAVAITIATPIGILGTYMNNIRNTYQTYFVHKSDEAAAALDKKKMKRYEFWYPMLISIPYRAIPVAATLVLGVDAVEFLLNQIPEWTLNGLSVAGGVLPALGFAITIMTIGKKELLPYFFLGFLIAAYTGMNMIGLVIVGVCIALIQSHFKEDAENEEINDDLDEALE